MGNHAVSFTDTGRRALRLLLPDDNPRAAGALPVTDRELRVGPHATIKVVIVDGDARVSMIGDFDLAARNTFAELLEHIWARPARRMIVDLAQTDFIDCSVLALLEREQFYGRHVLLLNAHGIVKRVLDVVHLDSHLRTSLTHRPCSGRRT
jgi:anti-anti-sigma factor